MIIQNSTRRVCGRFLTAISLVLMVSASAGANYQSTVLGDNPLAFYALNPGSDPSGTSPDLSGNGNNGFAWEITPAIGPSAYITNAANFNGTSSYDDISTGANSSLLIFAGPITLEAWVQPSSTSEFADIFAQGYENSNGYPEIVLRVNGPYGTDYVGGSENSNFSIYVGGGAQTTNWTYVVVSMDGTNCSLYVNGALVGRSADTYGSTIFPSPDDWVIGNGSDAGNGRYFNGNISEVAMYKYGLTAAQVQAHYNMGMYGTANPPPPPVGPSLKWSPNNNDGVWDTGISTNWINVTNDLPSVFNANDPVLFDDTVGVPTTVTVAGTDSPNSITVDSSTNNFTFSGSGTIGGSGGLVKEGSSTLTITSSGSFTGPVTVSGGAVYAGNNCLDLASSITITNNSTLDLAGGTFSDNTPVTVSGTGLNGEGAIYNSYSDYPAELLNITMAGDTTFGGSARWDLASGAEISGAHNLTVDWSAGAGYGQWNTMTIGSTVSGIFVTNGSQLGMSYLDTSCQNPGTVFTIGTNCQLIFYNGGFNGSIHVLSGGIVYIYNPGVAFNGSNLIFENTAQWVTYYNPGTNTISSAVTLNGVAHFIIGDHNMVYTNVISGPGGFVEDYYDEEMVFSASNTYSGPTIIGSVGNSPEVALTGNGSISQSSLIFFGGTNPAVAHIDVSGRSDQTLTLASGQTLAGIGGINGSLVVSPGATISPAGTNTTIGITTGANSTGTIGVANSITLNGTTIIKLNGSGVNDSIQSPGGGITYGGTLSLVNISGSPLAVGNSFQIFSATSYAGSFASITPATPGTGLAWGTSQLNIGVLNVIAEPSITSVAVSGGNLVFSGTNGTAGGPFYVLTTTNLTIPLTNWVTLSTNSFNANGTFSVTNAIAPGTPQRFYVIKSP
jgi:autotransporter-associated beta strand protein